MFRGAPVTLCSAVPLLAQRRVLRMFGLPKGWMHDEVVQFVDTIAKKVDAPAPQQGSEVPDALANSQYVRRVRIPFGRRTGVLYGEPTVEVSSDVLADALLGLTFDEFSDARRRMYFEEVDLSEVEAAERRSMERTHREEEEDRVALATMELDRFLLDPDVLYDMKKRRQRRRLTLSENIELESFRETVDEPTVKGQRDLSAVGKGAMQNMTIPVPYVRGRRGF